MAKVSLSVISIILILFVQGCHRQNTGKVKDSPSQSVDGEFAKIAGTWKSDDGLWEITNIDVRLGENVVQGNTVYVYSGNLSNDSGGWDTQRTEVFDFRPRFPMNDPNNPDVTP